MPDDKIIQTVELQGGKEVERQLQEIGRTGERAFDDLNKSADKTDLQKISRQSGEVASSLGDVRATARSASDALNEVGSAGSEASVGLASVGASGAAASAGLSQVNENARNVSQTLRSLGIGIAAAIAAVTSLGAALLVAARSAATAASAIGRAAEAAGVSVEKFQQLKFMLEQIGLTPEQAETAIKKMGEETETALDAAGKSVIEFHKQWNRGREVFPKTAAGMDALRSSIAQAAAQAAKGKVDADALRDALDKFRGSTSIDAMNQFANAVGKAVGEMHKFESTPVGRTRVFEVFGATAKEATVDVQKLESTISQLNAPIAAIESSVKAVPPATADMTAAIEAAERAVDRFASSRRAAPLVDMAKRLRDVTDETKRLELATRAFGDVEVAQKFVAALTGARISVQEFVSGYNGLLDKLREPVGKDVFTEMLPGQQRSSVAIDHMQRQMVLVQREMYKLGLASEASSAIVATGLEVIARDSELAYSEANKVAERFINSGRRVGTLNELAKVLRHVTDESKQLDIATRALGDEGLGKKFVAALSGSKNEVRAFVSEYHKLLEAMKVPVGKEVFSEMLPGQRRVNDEIRQQQRQLYLLQQQLRAFGQESKSVAGEVAQSLHGSGFTRALVDFSRELKNVKSEEEQVALATRALGNDALAKDFVSALRSGDTHGEEFKRVLEGIRSRLTDAGVSAGDAKRRLEEFTTGFNRVANGAGIFIRTNKAVGDGADTLRRLAEAAKKAEEEFTPDNLIAYARALGGVRSEASRLTSASELLSDEALGKNFIDALRNGTTESAEFKRVLEGLRSELGADEQNVKDFAAAFPQMAEAFRQAAGSLKDVQSSAQQVKTPLQQVRESVDALRKDASPESFRDFADALKRVKDESARLAIAQEVLGETAGKRLVERLKDQNDALNISKERYNELRLGVSKAQVAISDDLNRALREFTVVSKQGRTELGLLFAPHITPLILQFNTAIRSSDGVVQKLKRSISEGLAPALRDMFKALGGGTAGGDPILSGVGFETSWVPSMIRALGELRKVAETVFDEVLLPAFEELKKVARSALDEINKFFGTDISLGGAGLMAAITFLIGGFNSLALAIAAVFFGKGPIIDAFKEKMRGLGLDIDKLKDLISKELSAAWEQFKQLFSARDADGQLVWVRLLVEFLKSVPGIILQIVAAIVLLRTAAARAAPVVNSIFGTRFSGDALLGAVALGAFTGALDAASKIAIIFGASLGGLLAVLGILEKAGGLVRAAFGAAGASVLAFVARVGLIATAVGVAIKAIANLDHILESAFGIKAEKTQKLFGDLANEIYRAARALDEFLGIGDTRGSGTADVFASFERFFLSVRKQGFFKAISDEWNIFLGDLQRGWENFANEETGLLYFPVRLERSIKEALAGIGQFFTDLGNSISATFDGVIAKIREKFQALLDWFKGLLPQFGGDRGQPQVPQPGDPGFTPASFSPGQLGGAAGGGLGQSSQQLRDASEAALELANNSLAAQRAIDMVRTAIDAVVTALGPLGAAAQTALGAVQSAAETLAQQILAAFSNLSTGIQGVMAGLSSLIEQTFSSLQSQIAQAAEAVSRAIQAIIAQLEAAVQRVQELAAAARQAAAEAAAAGGGGGGSFAGGGYTGSGGRLEPAGVVHRGEHVQPARVVSRPGVLAFLEMLRRTGDLGAVISRFRGFDAGGLVTGITRGLTTGISGLNMSVPGAGSSERRTTVDLSMGGGVVFPVQATPDVAAAMQRFAVERNIARAGKRPRGGSG